MTIARILKWEVSDREGFINCLREFDKMTPKIGAIQFTNWQTTDGRMDDVVYTEIQFDNYAGLDQFDKWYGTQEAQDLSPRIRSTAKLAER